MAMQAAMRAFRPLLAAVAAVGALVAAGAASAGSDGASRQYVVVYKQGADVAAAQAAIASAGGTIVSENRDIGVATVRSADPSFQDKAAEQGALEGAARDVSIGQAPQDAQPKDAEIEKATGDRLRAGKAKRRERGRGGGAIAPEPLASLQWDMRMLGATPDGSYAVQQGSHAVRVGIIDTGIDGSHPDVAPNFDRELSRNFTIDDPVVDGPCEAEADQSCEDPADVDENGHGTHVASTIGSPINGLGIGGVAPKVDLVNLRAGQDSGYFFLGPTLDALTYAGDHGIDVVNMSFYIDPWLYNCAANPADSPAEQREQRLIISATQRAIDYARAHGVTTVAANGNENTDLGHPTSDPTSPDYPDPVNSPRERTVDNSCLSMPGEADGVIGVSSIGPSKTKADFSNYGLEQTDVSAPGGYSRDFFGTPQYRTVQNLILAAFPESVGRVEDRDGNGTPDIDADGNPTTPAVVKQGDAYYQWIQGTSMAAPHAVGVAALIVAEYGRFDSRNGGLTLSPDRVEQILRRTAVDTPCPNPATLDYPDRGPEYTATCEGNADLNGFYGDGIVNAFNAVTRR
ncbi:MAG: lantibiotic leader peptide-processing serine protease [Solirubrobacteraceae bacterium]|nr:lantibiotic leader peptide-processing serine protease [Solirubrobacteraceae bacterium]